MMNYKPIPLYDEIFWDLTTEACHILLIAPSGAGKSMLLSYLSAMILKRNHNLYVVDAKRTALGATFESLNIPVAKEADEIIELLTNLVEKMEATYKKYFDSSDIDLDSNFSKLNLKAHVLIFDEVLSALESGDKAQKVEMTRLLKQLALKGRMAGFSIVLTSQRLLATDLPKAITEQCQIKIVLGSNISEELFHVTTGYYKKDLATNYKGDVAKGYVVTPKNGLSYFEAPYMDFSKISYKNILTKVRNETDDR